MHDYDSLEVKHGCELQHNPLHQPKACFQVDVLKQLMFHMGTHHASGRFQRDLVAKGWLQRSEFSELARSIGVMTSCFSALACQLSETGRGSQSTRPLAQCVQRT